MTSKIIIMLTHNDKTVKNAIEVFDSCKDLPVDFWGFKDVGVPKEEMERIVKAMQAAGKTTFLEVVSYSEEECMRGAKLAVELGYDYLMGTIYYQSVFEYLAKQKIKFFPFCGKVSGSPSVLDGTFDEIISDARNLLFKGVDGIDLLAFRHEDGAGLAEAYCKAIDKPVVVAGSINTPARMEFINKINPWGFTMGSALFTENFAPGKSFRENLQEVLRIMDSIS